MENNFSSISYKNTLHTSYDGESLDKVSYNGILSVPQLLVFLLLIVFLARRIIGGFSNDESFLSFTSFLNWLQNTNFEVIDLKTIFNASFNIVSDWGAFNFLREFINTLGTALKGFTIIGSCLINLLGTIVQFLQFLCGF